MVTRQEVQSYCFEFVRRHQKSDELVLFLEEILLGLYKANHDNNFRQYLDQWEVNVGLNLDQPTFVEMSQARRDVLQMIKTRLTQKKQIVPRDFEPLLCIVAKHPDLLSKPKSTLH